MWLAPDEERSLHISTRRLINQAPGREDDVLNFELKNILGSNGIDMREDLRNQIAIGRQVRIVDLMLVSGYLPRFEIAPDDGHCGLYQPSEGKRELLPV